MNSRRRRSGGGVGSWRELAWRGIGIGTVMVLAFAATGCGGGSSSGSSPSASPAQPSGNTRPTGRGKLVVNATDVLGQPIAGATIRLSTYWGEEDRRGVTNASGVAEFYGVIADRMAVTAFNEQLYGITTDVRVPDGGVQTTTVVAWPDAPSAGGIARSTASILDVSDDGRTLEFTVWILQVPPLRDAANWAWGPDEVRVMACVPDPSNDASRFHPDCVAGVDGYDAAYDGADGGRAISLRRVFAQGIESPNGHVAAVASLLLMDQGTGASVADPADQRLFAAKYFLTQSKLSSPFPLLDEVALAAFAQSDTAQGQAALLPQQPVTVFPVENPMFTMTGRDLFPAVDALASLEGGAAPLLAAVDRMLDFADQHTDAAASLMVVTDGRDGTCGTRSQCRARVEALVRKSRDMHVAIVPVAMPGPGGGVDYETLGALALASPGGALFRAEDPRQLVPIFRVALGHQSQDEDQLQARFRIHAEKAGTFASGRTVLGQVRLEVCPFDCTQTYVPFAVEIP